MYKEIKLISKRNKVFRAIENNNTYIIKEFTNKENLNKEKEILNLLKIYRVTAPEIIKAENNSLYLSDLGDNTFLQWYERAEKQNAFDVYMVNELCKWFKRFYMVLNNHFKEQKILNDVNFRNFLIYENTIYGIDFELVKTGCIEEDAGKLLAFALTYTPVMTEWKINFRNIFLDILSKELNINKEKVIEEEKKELLLIEKRRGISIIT